MTDETLFADVCQTLARAGFDITSAQAGEGTGLRIRQEGDFVVVSWVPSSELDPAHRQDAEYEGIRAALRQALTEILTQAGYVARPNEDSSEGWVSRA